MKAGIFHILLIPFLLSANPAVAEIGEKPNVLLIAIDDLNDWVGCLGGHPQAVTPNIDRLAARGMLFTNAHCQGTLCNPSRISLLWGMRPSSTGFYDNHYAIGKEPEFLKNHVSLPAHFAANGYETLTAGKVFHSGTAPQSQVIGPDPGYWRSGLDKAKHTDPRWHAIWDFGPQSYDETEFTDHIIASWAAERLGEKRGKPFFLSVGFYRPHVPFFPPARVHATFADVKLPPVKPDDWDDIPAAAAKLTLTNPKIPTHEWMKQDGRWLEAVHCYLACIKWTDEQVGRLLDALDKGPNADDTIIVLFSDHGYHLGEKQRWEKFSLWERTTHVPLIVSVPGGLAGKTDRPAELLGIYPTLIALCGLTPNPGLEGVSLKPLLENPDAAWDHAAVSTLGQGNHAVRDGRWRYIRYADGSEELYDHLSDPNEWHNLVVAGLKPEQAEAIARLGKFLPSRNEPQRGSRGK